MGKLWVTRISEHIDGRDCLGFRLKPLRAVGHFLGCWFSPLAHPVLGGPVQPPLFRHHADPPYESATCATTPVNIGRNLIFGRATKLRCCTSKKCFRGPSLLACSTCCTLNLQIAKEGGNQALVFVPSECPVAYADASGFYSKGPKHLGQLPGRQFVLGPGGFVPRLQLLD